NKEFSKQNKHVKNSFGTVFDRLMQSINYNETAGIIIGPEVSRIFSEVLFQDIDREIENLLGELDYLNGRHYTIRRYVDDIFIFTLNETILNDVRFVVEDTLKKYKLTVNKQKTSITQRPFSTAKSGTINHLNEILTSLTSKFIDPENPEKVKKIYSKKNTVISYLNKIKSMFVLERENYNLASGYTISSLANIAIDLDRKCKANSEFMKNNERQIIDFFCVAIEIIFHLFFISPNHNSSVKICIFIDIICKNVSGMNSGDAGILKGHVFNLIHSYFERCVEVGKNSKIKKIPLENLNLL
ncbi:RNA-directed DNA polymerase, partial [Salmonella enterica]|nr:RNA-directed DNA polymerase [Salmonella enterica]